MVKHNKQYYDDVYHLLKKQDIKHYKVYYGYAWYQYCIRNCVEEAQNYIDVAIELCDTSNDADLFQCPEIIILGLVKVKVSDVYQLAAVIYGETSEEKAKKLYVEFQYHKQLEYLDGIDGKYPQERFILYSFRSYSTYSLEDLVNQTITFVHPSRMNDPFDTIAIEWSKQQNLDNICKRKHHIPFYTESYDYYRIRSFVANKSFTNCDKKVFGKLLMWSHYANSHTGYCIKYNLSRDFIMHNDADSCKARVLLPIDYSKKKFPLNKTKITYQEAYRTKAKAWHTEDEVRLLSFDPSNKAPFNPEKLDRNSWVSEIAFGYKCPQSTIDTICEVFKDDKRIRFVKMDIDRDVDAFTLIPKEI